MKHADTYTERQLQELDYLAAQNVKWMTFGEKRFLLRHFNQVVQRFALDRKSPHFIRYTQEFYPISTREERLRGLQALWELREFMIGTEALFCSHVAQRKDWGYREYLTRKNRISFHLKRFCLTLSTMHARQGYHGSSSLVMVWFKQKRKAMRQKAIDAWRALDAQQASGGGTVNDVVV